MRLNNSFTVNRWGLIGATLVFLTAFTPTLLAWPWAYTGVIAGIGALLGWAVGVGLRALIPGEPGRAGPGALLASVGVAILVVAVARGWNIEQAQLLGLAPPAWGTGLASVGLGFCVATALIAVFRHRQARIVLAVVVLVPALGIAVVGPSRVLSAGEKLDSEDPLPAVEAPTAPQRSGSADSHVDWATLGEQGAKFVNGGLDAAELEQATGRPAAEPIRLYAGRAAGDTHQARAQVIIEELERTNAAERDVLLVMLTPGNGWVSDPAAHGLELLYDGNTAIVAQQYSTQPSAFHMLDTTEVERSGTEFILPILRWWEELPVERRPLFYIYGESLGVTAAEAALTSPHNVAQRVDGVLLAGPPGVNPVYQDTVARRVDGTPAAAPIIAGKDSPQFATDAEAIRALDGFLTPGCYTSSTLLMLSCGGIRPSPGTDRTGWQNQPSVTVWTRCAGCPVSRLCCWWPICLSASAWTTGTVTDTATQCCRGSLRWMTTWTLPTRNGSRTPIGRASIRKSRSISPRLVQILG